MGLYERKGGTQRPRPIAGGQCIMGWRFCIGKYGTGKIREEILYATGRKEEGKRVYGPERRKGGRVFLDQGSNSPDRAVVVPPGY